MRRDVLLPDQLGGSSQRLGSGVADDRIFIEALFRILNCDILSDVIKEKVCWLVDFTLHRAIRGMIFLLRL